MKLESTLQNRVGLLHLTPMLDTVMLLLIFVLIGGSYVLHSGIEVDVPVSSSVLPIQPGAHIVTLAPDMGGGAQVMLNGDLVTMPELEMRLAEGRSSTRQVILRGDNLAPWGMGIRIAAMAKDYGYEVAISTGSPDSL
ncbi:MAG: biopolymer transporter ExbD [Verrucomicrobiales bacterium]|nr:biopolymer transporter ExbD [Verrucomicrobiae bacterium]